MKLCIMRHGEAEPLQAHNDLQRGLTPRGTQQAQASADWLHEQGMAGAVVIASPYRRAQQTAALVAATLAATAVETQALLEPEGDPRRITSWLDTRPESLLVLVTHMPLVGYLAGWLEEGVLASRPFGVAQVLALEMDVAGAGQASRSGLFFPAQ